MDEQNNDQKKVARFGLGLLIGTVLGGLAAFFFSPKSGKENREALVAKIRQIQKFLRDAQIAERVKEIYGETSEEAVKLYKKVSKELAVKLEDVKERWEEIDTERYIKIVNEVVDKAAKDLKVAAETAGRLKDYLVKVWRQFPEEVFPETVKKSAGRKK